MKKILGLLFVATLLISGCGTDDDDTLTLTGASGNQVNLDGQWSAGCVPKIGSPTELEVKVFTFSGSSLTLTENGSFPSADCSGQPNATRSFSASVTLGGEVTALLNSSPVTATKVDGVFSSAILTPNNSAKADDWNAESECGFTDWVAGTSKDVSATDCLPTGGKDILYIDDTVNPNLWYNGEGGGTLDENGYPTVLYPDDPRARL